MSKKPVQVDPADRQVDTIARQSPFVMQSLDLAKNDKFARGQGVEFHHYKAIPSPIGQNDRGDYRRSDGVDTITSNGFIYKCAGKFTATMTDNSRQKNGPNTQVSLLDPSQANLVVPRTYDNGETMYFAEGDRIYVADPNVDVKVVASHKMDYVSGTDNIPVYPIVELDAHVPLTDSQNAEYVQGRDFCITKEGNIRWHTGGGAQNPGIDPQTGKGRIYAIRYLYRAFWYVISMPKEVRITGVTNGTERTPTRMPYHLTVMREYMFHNKNRDDNSPAPGPTVNGKPDRADLPVQSNGNNDNFVIPVDMDDVDQG